MSNPHRGEVALEADGKTWTLKYSLNALCELEDEFDMPIAAMAEMLNDPATARLKHLRALLRVGLREHHPDLTAEQAGSIAQAAGIAVAAEKVGEAFQAAFPEAEGAGGKGRPKKALR